jgi:hypothetical protein
MRAIGNKSFLAYPLRRLGYLALEQGDILLAGKYLRESLTFNYEVGDIPGFTASLLSLAVLALQLDKPIQATQFYGLVERRLETYSIVLLYTDQTELSHIKDKLTAALPESVLANAFSKGWEMSEEQAFELAEKMITQGE